MSNRPDDSTLTTAYTEELLSMARRIDDLLMRVESLTELLRANNIELPDLPMPVGQTSLNQFIPTGDSSDSGNYPLL